jgi:hypothetical protein
MLHSMIPINPGGDRASTDVIVMKQRVAAPA